MEKQSEPAYNNDIIIVPSSHTFNTDIDGIEVDVRNGTSKNVIIQFIDGGVIVLKKENNYVRHTLRRTKR